VSEIPSWDELVSLEKEWTEKQIKPNYIICNSHAHDIVVEATKNCNITVSVNDEICHEKQCIWVIHHT
jgi:hypothetical protein